MPFHVAAAQDFGNNPLTITGLIQILNVPNPPATVAFQTLGPGGLSLHSPGQGAPIALNPVPTVVRSIGLITCASVCYINSANGQGFVYHANSGVVRQDAFQLALNAIGAPPNGQVYIALAHPDPTDAGYRETVANFVAWGIPPNNIVEISELMLNMFGLNTSFQIGY
jgi:hypothetical protein